MLTTMEIRRSKGLLADHGQEKLSQEMERLISRSLSGEAEPSIDSRALHHKRDVEMTDTAVAQTSCRSAYSVTDVPSQPSWVTRNEPGLPRKKQKGGRKAKIEKRKNTRTSRLNLAH